MTNQEAIQILRDIRPGADGPIAQALDKAIEVLNEEDTDKPVHTEG